MSCKQKISNLLKELKRNLFTKHTFLYLWTTIHEFIHCLPTIVYIHLHPQPISYDLFNTFINKCYATTENQTNCSCSLLSVNICYAFYLFPNIRIPTNISQACVINESLCNLSFPLIYGIGIAFFQYTVMDLGKLKKSRSKPLQYLSISPAKAFIQAFFNHVTEFITYSIPFNDSY